MNYCSSCKEIKYRGLTKVGEDCYICDDCMRHSVSEGNKRTYINMVYGLLSEKGFKDIQRDYVTIHVISRDEFAKLFPNNPRAVGMHCGRSTVHNERGRTGFEQDIYVVDSLHYIEFESILAHELLHAWQLQQNIEDYNRYEQEDSRMCLTEGFAQLGCYFIYSHYYKIACDVLKGINANMTVEEAKKIKSMCCDSQKLNYEWDDPAYGIAYKKIWNRMKEVGLEQVIREARLNELIKYV